MKKSINLKGIRPPIKMEIELSAETVDRLTGPAKEAYFDLLLKDVTERRFFAPIIRWFYCVYWAAMAMGAISALTMLWIWWIR